MKIYVVGIDDNREQYFSPEVEQLIATHHVFSGGKRHQEILAPYLPDRARWIPVTIPLSEVFQQYRAEREVILFASGDPLFFGIANTILRDLPEAEVKVYPFFNSLQLLAHRMLLPYQEMKVVSLTGRPWIRFDEALIEGHQTIGVLTDTTRHTPATIAERMLQYGYDNYQMTIGELLGNEEEEQVTTCTLDEVSKRTFRSPNNIILQRTALRPRPFGIPEQAFHLLNGRAKMITKMPIRLLSLSFLDLRHRQVMWDVGFCTGSVSVEAKLQFPHLSIYAFEKREEGRELLELNAQRFGTPGITGIIGDFTEMDLLEYPRPEAVFIGGHGGKMRAMMEKIVAHLLPNGVVVFNSVSAESQASFREEAISLGLAMEESIEIKVDEHNVIAVMKAVKKKNS